MFRTDHDTAGITVRSRTSSIQTPTRACTALSGQWLQRPSWDRWAGRMRNASISETASTKNATYGKAFTS